MNQHRAFTLVELSIVLVILGLLIGGVLTGQSLIRAAELRSISTQHSRFHTAVHTFRDKYFALPGDMANAQSYWGIQDATPATCRTTASTDSKTCNGDGDGKVGSNSEGYRFWQHLANAGLIEGRYDGVGHSTTGASVLNSPAGRMGSSLWTSYHYNPSTPTQLFDGEYGNVLGFGGTYADNYPIQGILKPEEAYNIDTKTDDGKPATGKIVIRASNARNLGDCTDTTSSSTLSAVYLLTVTASNCNLIYRQQY